jgi:hypothetical protein
MTTLVRNVEPVPWQHWHWRSMGIERLPLSTTYRIQTHFAPNLIGPIYHQLMCFNTIFFFFIVFYSGRDASHPEIWFLIHSHNSCRPSGDCGGSQDRTRNCCVTVWFTQSCLSQLSHHIPNNWATTSPANWATTSPANWATTSPATEPPHPRPTEPPHPQQLSHHIPFNDTIFLVLLRLCTSTLFNV